MATTSCFAALASDQDLVPHQIERRRIGPKDVAIDIAFCGVCHTDLHFAKNDWGRSNYPLVPGHEIVGTVNAVGADVKKFKLGQKVAVGCFVNSCHTCSSCAVDLEQYCLKGVTGTYNAVSADPGGFTYGGYAKHIVVDEHFVLRMPEGLDLAGAAPLLCAGITTYSPLKHWNIQAGMHVGVIGLGGLGHMGIKFAHAMGAQTTMITSSSHKAQDALRLGADGVLLSSDANAMLAMANQFDFLLNTIPVYHDYNIYLPLLKVDGTMCIVGTIGMNAELNARSLIMGRRQIAGSLVGGIKETQEMLDFCAQHQILSDIEMIPMDGINQAYERMQHSDVKYRFVIDMATLA
ncbi:MAG: NAD(P)-dependent alcohol dehydrogenase [Betaproteobacteria bacterium]|nr:NAD(P)-dependent alcohol dehydrogenase [Betaproteobacteria bacterium]